MYWKVYIPLFYCTVYIPLLYCTVYSLSVLSIYIPLLQYIFPYTVFIYFYLFEYIILFVLCTHSDKYFPNLCFIGIFLLKWCKDCFNFFYWLCRIMFTFVYGTGRQSENFGLSMLCLGKYEVVYRPLNQIVLISWENIKLFILIEREWWCSLGRNQNKKIIRKVKKDLIDCCFLCAFEYILRKELLTHPPFPQDQK